MFSRPRTRLVALTAIILAGLLLAACQQPPTQPPPTQPPVEFNPGDGLEHAPGVDGEVKTVTLKDPDGNDVTFTYEVIDGLAIVEGDMIIGDAADFEQQSDGIEVTPESTALYRRVCWTFLGINVHCENYRWPNATIPYTFKNDWDDPDTAADENQMMRDSIRDAMDEIEAVTIVRFVPRSGQDDYVQFRKGDGCSARVGREGGRQGVNLSTGCGKWATVHEMLHSLGIKHEHTRHDRNDFVQINFDNIRSGKKHNFETSDLAFDLGSYDYDSIMHYGRFAFCKRDSSDNCVGPTLETKPAGIPINPTGQLSAGDISAINRLYPGEPPTISITGPSSGSSFPHRGANIFFSADVVDPEGVPVTVRWRSNVEGLLGEGEDLTSLTVFTGNLSYGDHVITATAIDQQGNRASDTVSVTITNQPPTVEITAPTPGIFCVNEPINFIANVIDQNEPGGTIPDSRIVWRFNGAALETGANVTRSFSTTGPLDVRVRATDELGEFAEDALTLTIDNCIGSPPTLTITEPASDTTVNIQDFDTSRGQWYADVTLTVQIDDDDPVNAAAVTWTTNRSDLQTAVLGTGLSITARLYSDSCTGDSHTISVTYTDPDGFTRTVTRHIGLFQLC